MIPPSNGRGRKNSDKPSPAEKKNEPQEESDMTISLEDLIHRLEGPTQRRTEETTGMSFESRQFYEKLPLIPPQEIFHLLESQGYRGQEMARKAVSLMAYRHIKRLKKIHVENVPREKLPPKTNTLLMGPTGCGKTYLVELLFRSIFKLPTVIIDVTGFSETGYIGDDPKTILSRLLMAANYNPEIAMGGIVCLDEFDKLASGQNSARFDGQGTTKDVSGFGVQKELLKMMEASYIDIPMDLNNSSYSSTRKIYTGDIAFVACGAFSGFKSTAYYRQSQSQIGYFGTSQQYSKEKIAVRLEESEILDTENFQEYGFIPELLGRFTRIVPLLPLSKEELFIILKDNVIEKFQQEFKEEGLDLQVNREVLDFIVEKSLSRQIGARGLTAELTRALESVAYECFQIKKGAVQLTLHQKQFRAEFMGTDHD